MVPYSLHPVPSGVASCIIIKQYQSWETDPGPMHHLTQRAPILRALLTFLRLLLSLYHTRGFPWQPPHSIHRPAPSQEALPQHPQSQAVAHLFSISMILSFQERSAKSMWRTCLSAPLRLCMCNGYRVGPATELDVHLASCSPSVPLASPTSFCCRFTLMRYTVDTNV